ncbi:MAG: hypothetical protein NT166_22755 [Candidatus Aminicenantes bacterium]|nr:hypothetical protein [Candidatus Aminicenantes bacterium]
MAVNDILTEQKEIAAFNKTFTLWPKYWEKLKDVADFEWKSCPFDPNNVDLIPNTKGIYSFVINPRFTNHPQRYLCYIGKTDRTLKVRYRDYLRELNNETGRPKLLHLLNLWKGYIEFCYIEIENVNLLDLEKKLLDAFVPPCNDKFSAKVNRIIKAF